VRKLSVSRSKYARTYVCACTHDVRAHVNVYVHTHPRLPHPSSTLFALCAHALTSVSPSSCPRSLSPPTPLSLYTHQVSRAVYDCYREELQAWEAGYAMTAAHQSRSPRGLLYEVRRLSAGGKPMVYIDDEVLTPPEDEVGGGMEVERDGGGVSSPPPGEEDAGMDVED